MRVLEIIGKEVIILTERPIGFQLFTSQKTIESTITCPDCPFQDQKDEIMAHCPGFLLMQAGFLIKTELSSRSIIDWDIIGRMWQEDAAHIGCHGSIYEKGLRDYSFAMTKRRREMFIR